MPLLRCIGFQSPPVLRKKPHLCDRQQKTEGQTNLKVLDAVCSGQLTQTVALFSTYVGLFNVTVSYFHISV